MPGIQGIGPKGPYRRPVLATTTPLAQARGQAGKGPKWPKISASRDLRVAPGRSGSGDAKNGTNRDPGAGNRRLRAARVKHNMSDNTEAGMQDDSNDKGKKDSRQARLKLALRENLKRRKSQARGRSEEAAASSETADVSLDDSGEEAPRR